MPRSLRDDVLRAALPFEEVTLDDADYAPVWKPTWPTITILCGGLGETMGGDERIEMTISLGGTQFTIGNYEGNDVRECGTRNCCATYSLGARFGLSEDEQEQMGEALDQLREAFENNVSRMYFPALHVALAGVGERMNALLDPIQNPSQDAVDAAREGLQQIATDLGREDERTTYELRVR